MITAVYDNPATYCREVWKDGMLMAHISLDLMMTKGFNGNPNMHMALNSGPWKEGRILGDPESN